MRGPLTIAALKKCGMTVQAGRQETAAGHVDFTGFGFRRGIDRDVQTVITRLMHGGPDPRATNDAAIASRIPHFITAATAALAAARKTGDRAGFTETFDRLVDELVTGERP